MWGMSREKCYFGRVLKNFCDLRVGCKKEEIVIEIEKGYLKGRRKVGKFGVLEYS